MTPHLLQGQRRGSGEGATLEHLRAQGALLTLVLADGRVVHHGQERVLAIPQAGENILKEQKKKKKIIKIRGGAMGLDERKTVCCSAVWPQMLPSALLQAVHLQ